MNRSLGTTSEREFRNLCVWEPQCGHGIRWECPGLKHADESSGVKSTLHAVGMFGVKDVSKLTVSLEKTVVC